MVLSSDLLEIFLNWRNIASLTQNPPARVLSDNPRRIVMEASSWRTGWSGHRKAL